MSSSWFGSRRSLKGLEPEANQVLVLRQSPRRKLGSVLLGLLWIWLPPVSLYYLLQLLPGACWLRLDSSGLTVRHCFVTRRWPWDETSGFYKADLGLGSRLHYEGVQLVGGEVAPMTLADFFEEWTRLRGLFRTHTLPDVYSLDAAALARLLNRWDDHHGPEADETRAERLVKVQRAGRPLTAGFTAAWLLVGLAFGAGGVLMVLFPDPDGVRSLGPTGQRVVGALAALMGFVFAALLTGSLVGWWRRGRSGVV